MLSSDGLFRSAQTFWMKHILCDNVPLILQISTCRSVLAASRIQDLPTSFVFHHTYTKEKKEFFRSVISELFLIHPGLCM